MAFGLFNRDRDPNDRGVFGNFFKSTHDSSDRGVFGNFFKSTHDPNDHGVVGNLVGGLFGRKRTPTRKDDFTPPSDSSGASW